MLEFDDIQHFLLERPRAMAARYGFVTFRDPAQGRAYLAACADRVGTGASVRDATELDTRWLTVALTWNGLRTLGVDEASLATFPEEFRQGMAARAEVLGDTGANHPDHWVGGLASPELHALVILFARDVAERERTVQEHQRFLEQYPGVQALSYLDLAALPPYDYHHDHFGYRDRLTPRGRSRERTRCRRPARTRRSSRASSSSATRTRRTLPRRCRSPEILSRNGSYVAYRQLQEHVGAFRDFLREHGETPEGQELLAAKLMGRWRSGAPLVLAPEHDDPELGADLQRTNDFNYKEMDPHGYAVPLGAHIRRMNPRDTGVNVNRRPDHPPRRLRYGPPLPEDAPEDGVERGVAAFAGCASLVRQFEFFQNVWINDPNFHELGNERDPFLGTQDGTFDFTIPKRPIRKKITGLPAFTTVRGGAYFFLPGIRALRWLANLGA